MACDSRIIAEDIKSYFLFYANEINIIARLFLKMTLKKGWASPSYIVHTIRSVSHTKFVFSSLSKPPPPPPPPPPDDDVVVVLVNAKPNADVDKKDARGSGQDGRTESGEKLRSTPISSSMSFRSFTKLPPNVKVATQLYAEMRARTFAWNFPRAFIHCKKGHELGVFLYL